ncbi:MAG: alkaline phosphatase family protein [Chloroflexota bacterium]
MILVIVWDGLRPDMITPERTPRLHTFSRRGVFCSASHAAFPTATRINSASLATGCYPGRHGIVDNELYVPALDPAAPISCADWRSLQAMADGEGERLVSVPTVGEALAEAGRRMVAVGSGSPGTTYLMNPTVAGPVVNWAVAWPDATQRALEQQLGGMLTEETDSSQRNAFVLRALREHLVPAHRPDLVSIWLTEPDHAQHDHGLASPEALAALREIDAQLADLLAWLEGHTGGDLTCFLLSDHGFNTVAEAADPDGDLVAAGFKAARKSNEIVRTSCSLYVNGTTRGRIPELMRFLAARPWVGALFLRDDLLPLCPEAMPQSAVLGNHRRSAEIMFSYRWWEAPNAAGVPGSAVGTKVPYATHGSSAPHCVNNTLVAWGQGIKAGVTSDSPCGIVDISPTVLHLLGVAAPPTMQGRVLHELLAAGPDPLSLAVTRTVRSALLPVDGGVRRQVARYSRVAGSVYFGQAALDDAPQR